LILPTDNEPTPVVEPKPGETAPAATSRALDKRIRQQEILAEIGVAALQGGRFERLLAETVRLFRRKLRESVD
jgi:hypothetical protein